MATKRPGNSLNSRGHDSRQTKAAKKPRGATKRSRRVISVTDPGLVGQWAVVGMSKGLSSDAEIAGFLLSLYNEGAQHQEDSNRSARTEQYCVHCSSPLTLYCLSCRLPAEKCSSSQLSTGTAPSELSTEPASAKLSSKKTFAGSVSASKGSVLSQEYSSLRDRLPHSSQTSKQSQASSSPGSSQGVDVIRRGSSLCLRGDGSESGADSSLQEGPTVHRLAATRTTDSVDSTHKVKLENCSPPLTRYCDDAEDDDTDQDGMNADDDDNDDVKADASLVTGEDGRDDFSTSIKDTKSDDPPSFVCPFCRLIFKDHLECKAHVKEYDLAAKDGTYKCQACSKVFPRYHCLYRHIELRADQQVCSDSSCGVLFTSGCQVRAHNKQHTRYCPLCDKYLSSKKDLGGHMRKHLREDELENRNNEFFLCGQCGKEFKKQDDLKKHMSYHNKDDPFPCTFPSCGKAFKNKGCLQQHWKITHEEKRHQCEICGSKFCRKCDLKRHMVVHTEVEKLFACEQCGRRYHLNCLLTDHIKSVHSGIRRHACSECDMTFYKRAALLKHELKHKDERPFLCEDCSASFKYKNALMKHRENIVVSEIKPFQCGDCMQRFAGPQCLKYHRMKYHVARNYACRCGQTFVKPHSLSRHVKRFHSQEFSASASAQTGLLFNN